MSLEGAEFRRSQRKWSAASGGEGGFAWRITETLDNINIGVTLRNVMTKFVWSTSEILGPVALRRSH
jgi:hypothetical protein